VGKLLPMTFRSTGPPLRTSRGAALAVLLLLLVAMSGCSNADIGTGGPCAPPDQDGVIGGKHEVLLNVSDTSFAVGGVDSGSSERNITIQNKSRVTLTLTNVGSTPHSFVIQCIPSGLAAGCETRSCFPDEASIPAVQPGGKVTTTFVVPAVEGAYPFTSDVAGDTDTAADGTVVGLIGQFVIM
jgi:hypothetical protein